MMDKPKGAMVSFEGTDGSGKSTVLTQIVAWLVANGKKQGQDFIVTREPGGCDNPIAEQIRQLILDKNNNQMDAWCEALLYAASRRQHVVQTILPALAAGKLVLCDRYVDSSLAYQGGGRQLGVDKIAALNQAATDSVTPDVVILCDVAPEVGLKRIFAHRTDQVNRLDEQSKEFYQRTNAVYQQLAKTNPHYVRIDANQNKAAMAADVKQALMARLPEFFSGIKA